MQHIFFYLGLSFIVMHEMDAIRCREWRIFPGISLLKESAGFIVFMLAHIPLYVLLFWSLMARENTEAVIKGLNMFFIIHMGLHLLFLMHTDNEFKDFLSWFIISGAAICGAVDLLLT
jgi:hypothetical protein